MIEKLEIQDTWGESLDKLNKLVDVVNGILAQQEEYRQIYDKSILPMLTPQNEEPDGDDAIQEVIHKTPADPYAEQRKWIGSLVEYKLGDLFLYGILTDIKDGYTLPFVIDGASYTDDCWLPDESVIYHKTKGGDNE